MKTLLRMVQVDKSFPGVHALDHVDFELREGEVHVLLGENGAGKSTLMKILMIGQRVTVLRDGKVIGTLPVEEAAESTLVNMMVGRRLTEQYPKHAVSAGKRLLRIKDMSVPGALRNISLDLHEAEILAVFGLMGAGQQELTRAIFGLEPISSGRMWIADEEVRVHSPADAIRHGLGLLTRDRRYGLVPALPVPPNITLANLSQLGFHQTLNLRSEAERASQYVESLRIQPPSLDRPVMFLSGGNQQKVVLARWLFSEARVLIFDEPTRGIDVGAKAEVFALINQLVARRVGIIMVSSEMPEILAIADRVKVIRDGEFAGEFKAGEATPESKTSRRPEPDACSGPSADWYRDWARSSRCSCCARTWPPESTFPSVQ